MSAVLVTIDQVRMEAQNCREISKHDPALAQVAMHGISRGDWTRLAPHTSQRSPLALVRTGWKAEDGRQCWSLEMTM